MRPLVGYIFVAIIGILSSACSKSIYVSNIELTKEYEILEKYTTIKIDGDIEVYFTDKTENKIDVMTSETVQEYVTVSIANKVLEIKLADVSFNTKPRVVVSIPTNVIKTLSINGFAKVKYDTEENIFSDYGTNRIDINGNSSFNGHILGDTVKLSVGNSSRFEGKIAQNVGSITIYAKSSASVSSSPDSLNIDVIDNSNLNINLNNSIKKINISCKDGSAVTASGGAAYTKALVLDKSTVMAKDFNSRIADITIEESSSGEFRVTEKVDLILKSSSQFGYYGSPVLNRVDVSNNVSIFHRGE